MEDLGQCSVCSKPYTLYDFEDRCAKCGTCWMHCRGHEAVERNDGVMDMTYRELELSSYFED